MQAIDIKSFQDTLSQSKSVLIVLPENPAFDHVAGALSLHLAVKEWGKEVNVVCTTPMIVEFNRLVGVDKVCDNVADKNLTIAFENYDASDIEKVSWNIEDGQFTLLVSPKSGITAPSREQVKLGYRGIAAEIVIVVGAQSKNELGKLAQSNELFGQDVRVAVVNNTPSSGFASPMELINPQASSLSEVVFQLIESMGLPINRDIASNLFMGVRTGTNNFSAGGVNADTFATAARLMRAGASIGPEVLNVKPGKIPGEAVPADWKEPKIYKGSTLP